MVLKFFLPLYENSKKPENFRLRVRNHSFKNLEILKLIWKNSSAESAPLLLITMSLIKENKLKYATNFLQKRAYKICGNEWLDIFTESELNYIKWQKTFTAESFPISKMSEKNGEKIWIYVMNIYLKIKFRSTSVD